MDNTKSHKKTESLVSVVCVLPDVETQTQKYIEQLYQHLDENFTDFEILLIDKIFNDVIPDEIKSILKTVPSVRYLQISTRTHHDIALAAGLENAIGDFVVLQAIGEDPVDVVVDLVNQCRQGSDIVIGVSPQRQTPGYQVMRPFMQWILAKIGYDLPRNASGLRCLSRRTVNAVTQTGRFHHQFYVRINKTGYKRSIYQYKQLSSTKKRTLRDGLHQGINLLVFNSTKPLRWMSGLGLFGSLLAFVFATYSILIRLIKDDVIEGWTTMVLFSSLLFSILFVILAFLGEYLGRLLDDRNEQQDYSVALELTSNVKLNDKRLNIAKETTE